MALLALSAQNGNAPPPHLQQVVRQADQVPFHRHALESVEQELAEAADAFAVA